MKKIGSYINNIRLYSTNYKDIGTLYIIYGAIAGIVGLLFSVFYYFNSVLFLITEVMFFSGFFFILFYYSYLFKKIILKINFFKYSKNNIEGRIEKKYYTINNMKSMKHMFSNQWIFKKMGFKKYVKKGISLGMKKTKLKILKTYITFVQKSEAKLNLVSLLNSKKPSLIIKRKKLFEELHQINKELKDNSKIKINNMATIEKDKNFLAMRADLLTNELRKIKLEISMIDKQLNYYNNLTSHILVIDIKQLGDKKMMIIGALTSKDKEILLPNNEYTNVFVTGKISSTGKQGFARILATYTLDEKEDNKEAMLSIFKNVENQVLSNYNIDMQNLQNNWIIFSENVIKNNSNDFLVYNLNTNKFERINLENFEYKLFENYNILIENVFGKNMCSVISVKD